MATQRGVNRRPAIFLKRAKGCSFVHFGGPLSSAHKIMYLLGILWQKFLLGVEKERQITVIMIECDGADGTKAFPSDGLSPPATTAVNCTDEKIGPPSLHRSPPECAVIAHDDGAENGKHIITFLDLLLLMACFPLFVAIFRSRF